MANFSVSGNIVDVLHKTIFPGTVVIVDGKIQAIVREEGKQYHQYLLPGFIDAHVHIESSMLVPTEFARLATVHGTVAVVSDPHEIANVLGLAGVRFMLANAAQTPLKIAFGAPSCVPATEFETAGAKLTAREIRELFQQDGISYLSEVMNVPGVLAGTTEVMAKIRIAQEFGLPVDGHAPGLRGEDVRSYAAAKITTDHECSTLAEALDKLAVGMKIIIREGSAAKNFEALHSLINSHPSQCMFGSDDKHPDDLVKGHINELVRSLVALGYDVMKVLQIACVNPVLHYNLNVGLLQVGDAADLIVVNNLREFEVLSTYCKGILVAKAGKALISSVPVTPINNFTATEKQTTEFRIPAQGTTVRVISAFDGQLMTEEKILPAQIQNGEVIADIENDVLKITVVNRYQNTPPAVALIHNFGFKRGAIASSVAHDSHNIVAVGASDREICAAVNAVIRVQGGIAVVEGNSVQVLPLPVAGLMSAADGYEVAKQYAHLDAWAKRLGTTLSAPFMTLAFMALLVIPDLKLSDRGLFSGKDFKFVSLWFNP
ncbi:adenine deaminase [Calothrix sp. UHCC 0171]|uniref:adenine deaminase n=1 Tax=Calothrix sp. UHCC 0171 TaxID=3110245 RepID=UPI002B1F0461|nr:adenine deaminase [Calothrix sp. UHCC 0171]MEA5572301.1 adenine deaminase [Calothrix sp. UHCC 0171]